MIRFFILSLVIFHVSSKRLWDWQNQPKLCLFNVTLEKNKPIAWDIKEDRVLIEGLRGTLQTISLSQLKVKDLGLAFFDLKSVEPGGLCSFSTLKRLQFVYHTNTNLTINKDTFKNCENLEELAISGMGNEKSPVQADITENLSKLTNLFLSHLEIDHLTRDFFKNLPLLESLTISSCSFKTIDDDAFEDLKNLKDLEINSDMPELTENLQVYFGKAPKLEQLTFEDLNGTLSSDWLAKLKLKQVKLTYKYLNSIEEGAICSSPLIKRFQLIFRADDGVTISKEAFKNCENLENLAIVGSKKNQVDADAFEYLNNLKSLELSDLEISHLTREYFRNLEKLNLLRLHSISVTKIDEDALEDVKNLKSLDICFNNFQHIPEKLFAKLTTLETLLLASNKIKNLTWDEFKGLSSLKKLNLRNNEVESLDAEKISTNMPSLTDFDFVFNFFSCNKEKVFKEKLEAKIGHPVRTTCDIGVTPLLDFGF